MGAGELPRHKALAIERLGPQAKCFIDGGDSIKGPVGVGDQLILVGQLWGSKCHHHETEISGLGVVTWMDIQLVPTGLLRTRPSLLLGCSVDKANGTEETMGRTSSLKGGGPLGT